MQFPLGSLPSLRASPTQKSTGFASRLRLDHFFFFFCQRHKQTGDLPSMLQSPLVPAWLFASTNVLFFFFRILSSFCCDKWRKRNRAFQREEITVSFFRNGNYALLFSVAGNVSDFSRLPRATFYSACMSFLSRCNAAFFFFYCCSAYFLLNLSVVAEMLRPYMLRQPFFVLPLLNHHSFYQKAAKIEIQCCLYCYYYAAKDCLFFFSPFHISASRWRAGMNLLQIRLPHRCPTHQVLKRVSTVRDLTMRKLSSPLQQPLAW